MIGRGLIVVMASMTAWLKSFGTVDTPMMAVGRIDSMAARKSRSGACGWANGFWKSARSVRLLSSRPRTSKSQQRAGLRQRESVCDQGLAEQFGDPGARRTGAEEQEGLFLQRPLRRRRAA